ncbi:MAG: response regulator transcription factor [Flavobacterium sp.]|uniref:response regulator n=1 Tax=Flavobacterium sp. TaxID=239 RepID=UPI001217099E|nr:response regulator [Flavobacterium sp.]RZJ68336.1 MAG: response regulator transcription factor [Flavobacterium sp.]
MFKKVLVAEDFDGYNIAVAEALKALEITNTDHAPWCDEALLKMVRALEDGNAFDLLVSDLSFKPDHRTAKLTGGEELIAAARELQPDIKILVYSIEDRPHPLQYLFNELNIDGYVLKGRNNIPEIRKAITAIAIGEQYISPQISHVLQDRTLHEIEEYDRELMKMLSEGVSQAEISLLLQNRGINPNSVSSIEKRINRLKITLRANNNVHLIVIAKDLGLV